MYALLMYFSLSSIVAGVDPSRLFSDDQFFYE